MNYIKQNIVLALISLLLNGIWEYAVCAYFYDNDVVLNMAKLMVEATVGDVVVTIAFYNLITLLKKDGSQIITLYDYFNLSIYGIAAAFYFESKALAINRWAYSEMMPLLGQTPIGLLPTIQFALLIPLSVYLKILFWKKISIDS